MSHVSYGIHVNTATLAALTVISAVESQNVSTGTSVVNDVDAGSPYPQHVAINEQKPEAAVTTKDIRVALDLLGTEGLKIDSGVSNPGLDFWQLLLDPATGRVDAGSVHRRLNIHRGIFYPTKLTCDHARDARLDLKAIALWDPTATPPADEPLVAYLTQAAPTGLAGNERYTLHAAEIGGIDLDCQTKLELDFGNDYVSEGCNSDIWDSSLHVNGSKPMLTISGKHVAKFAGTGAIPLVGKRTTHATGSITLRRRSQASAGFTATTNTDHIQITVDGLAYWETPHEARANGRSECALKVACQHDGTNVPVIIDTAYALEVA